MLEISTHFFLLHPSPLVSEALLRGQMVALPAGTKEFTCTGTILFEQVPTKGDDGISWNQTFRTVTTDPGVLEYKDMPIHPAFRLSDGTIRVMGTHDAAPTVSITPENGGHYLVQAEFDAPEALIL